MNTRSDTVSVEKEQHRHRTMPASSWQQRSNRVLAVLERLTSTFSDIDEVYWVQGVDDNAVYCFEHAREEVARLKNLHPRNRSAFWLGGGHRSKEHGVAACDCCGKVLAYDLSPEGLQDEVALHLQMRNNFRRLSRDSGAAIHLENVVRSATAFLNPKNPDSLTTDVRRLIARLEKSLVVSQSGK